MENLNPISNFFYSKTAVDVSPEIQKIDKNVIALRTTDSIIDAVNILGQYHILCAPVINEEIPQIVGLFGLEDVTSYLAQKINSNSGDHQNLASLLVGNETILNLVNFSGRNPMELIRHSDTALAAASLLSDGLHRIIVLDANQCVCAMITQADLARLVHNNITNPSFSSILSLPLSKLGVTPKPVRSVLETDSVKKVLNIMQEFGGVVAVVDNSNKLVGNFSPSDFKAMPKSVVNVDHVISKKASVLQCQLSKQFFTKCPIRIR